MAAALPANTILAEAAAAAARRVRLPAPRNVPIDHFVVLMMENRSFDHYFGWVPRRGRPAAAELPGPGRATRWRPATSRRSGAAAWSTRAAATRTRATAGTRAARSCSAASSRTGRGNDEFALTYFNDGELGFIHEAARTYTLYDRYFCSLLASTWPNRYYKWSAQSGGLNNNDPPVGTAGNQWETIFDRAIGRGVSARYYASDLPFSAVVGPARRDLDEPDHALLRGLRGRHASEHHVRRPALPRRRRRRRPLGRRAPARRRAARPGVHGGRGERVRESPNYRRGALFVIYDEWGGFFDHVTPAERAGRPRERRPGPGLRADGLPDSRAGGVAVLARQAPAAGDRVPRGPRRVRPRVGPEADLVPVRPRRPDAPHVACAQHRAELRLGARRLRHAAAARSARGRHRAVLARRRRRARQPGRSRGRPGRARVARRALRRAELRGQAGRHLHAARQRSAGPWHRRPRVTAPWRPAC